MSGDEVKHVLKLSPMKKWFALILIILLGIVAYQYVYQDHRDISKETADYNITSLELISEFPSSLENSQTKFLNKTILFLGNYTI